MKMIDLTGKRFGVLTVLYRTDDHLTPSGQHLTNWRCKCDCGSEIDVLSANLRKGHTQSCGCLFTQRNLKHSDCVGGKISRLYCIWAGMKARCYAKSNPRYKYYGARGITVCKEWKNNFEAFREWAFANGYDNSLTIDRINNNGMYSPDNCRLTTQSNNSRQNVLVEYMGENHTISEWADIVGLPYKTLWYRFNAGWGVPEALFTPLRKKGGG